jgi:hypothetical protein
LLYYYYYYYYNFYFAHHFLGLTVLSPRLRHALLCISS